MKRTIWTIYVVFWICATLPAFSWAQHEGHDHGDSGLGEVAERLIEENPELRRAQQRAEKRSKRWKERKREGLSEWEKDIDDEAMDRMLEQIPKGPAQMEDLRGEAAVEKARLGMESIESAVEEKSIGDDIKPLFRNYLITWFFYGNSSTQLGAFIHTGLTTPYGWRAFPTNTYRNLPGNIAGMYGGGHVDIDPVKGNNIIVFSHEWWHHMGKPDTGPDSAYVHMGTELRGGSAKAVASSGRLEELGEGVYIFQCAL